MKRFSIVVLFVFFGSITGFSQSFSRVTSGSDVGLGYLDDQWVPSVMYHQELSLNHFSWFRIGWGVRAWGYYAGKTNLLPQNSALSSDTLKYGRVSANGASFLLGANVRLWRFDIGANTDLFGVAFGVKRHGLYTKSTLFDGEGSPYYNRNVASNPASLNALPLFLDKNNGQSELYIRFWFSEEVGVKLGYTYGRLTYASAVKLDNGQKRYSTTYGVPSVAVSFRLYN